MLNKTLSRISLFITFIFILVSCNGSGQLPPEAEDFIDPEIASESPVAIESYLKDKYRDKCAEEIIDGEIFESIFYRKNDPSCIPEKRSARCEAGILVIEGDESFTELSCETAPIKEQNVCRKGKVLKIGIDRNDDGVVDDYVGDVLSYKGELGAADNFNYYSWSAHPLNGISPKGYAHHIYFYEGADGLSLQFYYNVDAGGSANNKVNVELDVFNNELNDRVILADDRGEIKQKSISENHNKYLGKYHYWYNTDGGVIGPLGGEQFRIVLRPKDYGDISESKFYSADGSIINLMTDDQDYSYIIEYKDQEECNDGSFVQCEDVNSNYLQDSSFEKHGILSSEEIDSGKSKWDVLKEIGAWKAYKKSKAGIEVQVSNQSFAGLKALDGHAKVELDAHARNGFKKSHTHMYQDFIVEKDHSYTIAFFHAARVVADSNRFKVRLSKVIGGKLQRVFEKSYSNRTKAWSESKLKFFADQEQYRVEFMGVGHENTYGAYLDYVRVLRSDYFLLTDEEKIQCSEQPQDDPENPEDPDEPSDDPIIPVSLKSVEFLKPSEAQLVNTTTLEVEGVCHEGATVYLSGDILDKVFTCSSLRFRGFVKVLPEQGQKRIIAYQQLGESVSLNSQVNFNLDNQIPVVSLNQPEDVNFRTIEEFSLAGSCSESQRNVTITIENLNFSRVCENGQWNSGVIDISSLSDGEIEVEVNHIDLAGNAAIKVTRSFLKDTRKEKPIAIFAATSFLYPSISLDSSASQVQGAGSEISQITWEIKNELSVVSDLLIAGASQDEIGQSEIAISGSFQKPSFKFPKDCARYQVCLVVEDDLGVSSNPVCQNFESIRENIQLAISRAGTMNMTWDMFDNETVDVNWGDGSTSESQSGVIEHFYEEPQNRQIEVSFCAAAVKNLNLARNSSEPAISGVIPNLSRLTKVEDVNLSGNDIAGEIPRSHFPLSRNLNNFDISENNLSGSLPAGLFDSNVNLQRIDFKFNDISGVLPSGLFSNNLNLEIIELQRNEISGELNKNLFTGLSRLEVIELANNKLTGSLDGELFQSNAELKRVSLNNNELTGTISGELFEKNLKITNINLSSNQLSGSVPANVFSFNDQITGINLSRNNLSGEIPANLFSNNPLLGALYLDSNEFSGNLADNLFSNNNVLTLIDISANQFAGEISRDLLSSNIELSNINFSNNNFVGEIRNNLFSANIKLERINLEANQFASFEDRSVFNTNIKLRNLDLSHNQFNNSVSVLSNSDLRSLDMAGNNLSQSDLDNIILELVSVGGANGEVLLNEQLSGASFNPQASIFVDTLESRGWSVVAD